MRETTDILISGGGVAGLAAACAFGSAGFSVICVEPNPPVTEAEAEGSDLRTTAFLHPSIPVLEAAGLWQRLEPHAAALQIMRIVDAGGEKPEPRVIKDFDATDLSDKPFGWNLPNWLLRREMLARIGELPNVRFLPGVGTASVLTRETEALVGLSDGRRIAARLLIGADGRNSTVRQALDIPVKTLRYGQKALAFAVSHPIPHGNISTEIHRSGGPFTFVPLPDRDGLPRSAVVWMDHSAEIDRRMALSVAGFEAEIMERSCGLLGPLTLVSRLTSWPIIAQIAARMSGERVALMAEAAHVMPPIGAQGLNMSLADLTALLDLAQADPAHLGNAAMLDAYHRKRHLDVEARVRGIDLLNRASQIGAQPLRDLRAATLDALYSVAPVRRGLMRAGIGVR
ncbi:2-octaprenyl-6-methoxyphenyl hydroxylase [Gemmobacter nanjingensis]|uniref:2-octaprenyl-6-methoxyphenyl hydroxylase n=1 Tax=Gemmobacter nanjingensis TaxID=488454 RepID=A0ABQ3F9Z1_9RHOB|nr:UbiH/UbiF family hydroxylase [Gemmobacter nanjingensis]GHC15045.1 2-octaprenyl-6-methoxyphenyl hydroxylase [Gemmobacter nanjingensis]